MVRRVASTAVDRLLAELQELLGEFEALLSDGHVQCGEALAQRLSIQAGRQVLIQPAHDLVVGLRILFDQIEHLEDVELGEHMAERPLVSHDKARIFGFRLGSSRRISRPTDLADVKAILFKLLNFFPRTHTVPANS